MGQMSLLMLVAAQMGACSFSTKLGGPGGTMASSSSSSGSSGAASSASSNAQLPMPDLLGKTPEEALAALRAAGFEPHSFEEESQHYTCDYDRRASYELFTVCYQRPAPGQLAPVRVFARYEIERSRPGRGDIGTPSEYVVMPDVVGKSLDEARAVLAAAGLPVDKHFDVEVASAAERCEYEVVCYTSPGRKLQKRLTSRGTIVVGRPKPPPSADKPAAPPPPTPPSPPSAPAKPEPPSETYF